MNEMYNSIGGSLHEFADFHCIAHMFLDDAFARLHELVLSVPEDRELFSCSVHYEGVDKLVLWNSDDNKMQVRLHVYAGRSVEKNTHNQVDIAQAHNHRWNFATKILAGSYFHTIYRLDRDVLTPVMMRRESPGCGYSLHHSQFHSIIEEPSTVSLIVRGPLEKGHFQVATEEAGLIEDAPNLQLTQERKTMTIDEYKKVLDLLFVLKVLEPSYRVTDCTRGQT